MTVRRRLRPQAAMLMGALFGVAGCAGPPRTIEPVAAAAPAPSRPLAVAPVASVGPDGKPVLFNDPPAAPDTPLCGRQALEANTIGAQLQGAAVAGSGICGSFACYDPLTATYIGADGYRHVCR